MGAEQRLVRRREAVAGRLGQHAHELVERLEGVAYPRHKPRLHVCKKRRRHTAIMTTAGRRGDCEIT